MPNRTHSAIRFLKALRESVHVAQLCFCKMQGLSCCPAIERPCSCHQHRFLLQNHRKIHLGCLVLVLPAHWRKSRCNQFREH
nr:MAG TPA: hypothetical protein [Bacteriophage sp.]